MFTVRLIGGMGNQLFQYAFAKARSLDTKSDFQMDLNYLLDRTPKKGFTFRNYGLDIFAITPSIYKKDKKLFAFRVYTDRILVKLCQVLGINNLYTVYIGIKFGYETVGNVSSNCYFIGYFQSYKYFHHIQPLLQEELVLKEPIDECAREIYTNIQLTNSVCLHIRKGDYVNHSYHNTLDFSYYNKSISYIKEVIGDITIFIFSDDINWCKANFITDVQHIFVGNDIAGKGERNHFELMRSCKHFIIANSSFSWWAAYLAIYKHKVVVAPRKWFKNDNRNVRDIILPEWKCF